MEKPSTQRASSLQGDDRPGRDSAVAARRRGAPGHAEWLLDQAVEDTFPASDPPASSYPGSTVYEIQRRDRTARMRRVSTMMAVGVAAACAVVGLFLLRRRASRPAPRRD